MKGQPTMVHDNIQIKKMQFYRWSCSGVGLLVADDVAVLPFSVPLSTGTATPHFLSVSEGSITLMDPSVSPTPN